MSRLVQIAFRGVRPGRGRPRLRHPPIVETNFPPARRSSTGQALEVYGVSQMLPDLGALDGGALCYGSAGAGPLDSGLRPHPLDL